MTAFLRLRGASVCVRTARAPGAASGLVCPGAVRLCLLLLRPARLREARWSRTTRQEATDGATSTGGIEGYFYWIDKYIVKVPSNEDFSAFEQGSNSR